MTGVLERPPAEWALTVGEPVEPRRRDAEKPVAFELVAALAAARLHGHEARVFENAEVASRRGSRTIEARGEVTRGHGSSAMSQHQENLASSGMRQRREHRFEVVELSFSGWSGQRALRTIAS